MTTTETYADVIAKTTGMVDAYPASVDSIYDRRWREDQYYSIAPASDEAMLRHLMEAKGITQAELHRSTGIAKSTISEVLAGKKPFSRQMIRALADYFEVDASMLAANI